MNQRPLTPQSVTLPAIPRAGLCLPEVTILINLLKSARILARITMILARIAIGTERICYAPHVVSWHQLYRSYNDRYMYCLLCIYGLHLLLKIQYCLCINANHFILEVPDLTCANLKECFDPYIFYLFSFK